MLTSDADGLASWKGDFNEYTVDYTNLSDGDWVTIAQVGDGAENMTELMGYSNYKTEVIIIIPNFQSWC